ncbi:MAG: GNAT family N-acetyltransferase [bacterium]|nr:GNAT family N-acetyltransferase [bacterium]
MYTIRKAEPSDIPALINFRARMFELVWKGGGNINAMNEYSGPYFIKKMAANEFHAWIAETESGKPVACSALSFYYLTPKPSNIEGKYGYISSMFTDEAHRRKGLARKLLQAALDHAKSVGLQTVKLHASEYGQPLYESVGFTHLNEMGINLEP